MPHFSERFEKLQSQDKTAANLETAFSVEALSNEFFDEYRYFYQDLVNFVKYENDLLDVFIEYANGDKDLAEKYARDYIKKLMGRLVFIQFLQNKAWLDNDIHYTHTLFDKCSDEQRENFLDNILEPLFFGVFNTPKNERQALFRQNHWDDALYEQWKKFPYLNGGLFECDELDKLQLPLPSYFFSNPEKKDHVRTPNDKYYSDACGIFDFFDRYNFTIDESDPLDTEIGVDPEMLGKIFENLLEDNKDKGAFYTPKEIVNYMCREALVAYLIDEARRKSEVNKQRQESFEDAIRAFVTDPEMTVTRMQRYGDQQLKDLNDSLCEVKICDPAIGSGAFPMGLLNLLMNCRVELNKALHKGEPRAWLKKEIIQNNIYGVDIEKGAIDIARLRFWLSIVVDLEEPEALPNFDYKFMQGNSLLEQYNGVDLSQVAEIKKENTDGYQVSMFENELDVCRRSLHDKLEEYFGVTNHLTKQNLRNDISALVQKELDEQHIKVDLSNIDVSANDKFFLWHTWFADVFNRPSKQGFDIVIGNPPYGEIRDLNEEQQIITRSSPYFKYAKGGRVNLFQFFYPLALGLSRKGAIVSFIVQNSLMAEDTTKGNRKFLLDNSRIIRIDSFPERYDINKRVFRSVTMSVCICMVENTSLSDYDFTINIWEDKFMQTKKQLTIKKSNIPSLYPDSLILPSCDQVSLELLVKIKNKANYKICAQAGEVDMTKYKPYFTQDTSDIRIITGSNIASYSIATSGIFGKNYLLPLNVVNTLSRPNVRFDKRIVMQRITGVNAPQRFIGGILSEPLICANSTNYISEKDNSIDLRYLLALLNSHLMTYYDKLTNTNANITTAVLGALPIINVNDKQMIALVDTILAKKKQNPKADTSVEETAIDKLVYQLYELTNEEINLIEKG